jgi:hypothetical protein
MASTLMISGMEAIGTLVTDVKISGALGHEMQSLKTIRPPKLETQPAPA